MEKNKSYGSCKDRDKKNENAIAKKLWFEIKPFVSTSVWYAPQDKWFSWTLMLIYRKVNILKYKIKSIIF